MTYKRRFFRVSCPRCGATQTCGPEQMVMRLRTLGMLRREKEPTPDLLVELFCAAAERLRCDACGDVGQSVSESSLADDDWGLRLCEGCGKPIAPQRLELLPATTHCAACQRLEEAGTAGEVEYCPRCGAVMTTKLLAGGGITRYVTRCPDCGAGS